MFKKVKSLSIVAVVALITAIAGAGAGIYSWVGWYQPQAPQQLKK